MRPALYDAPDLLRSFVRSSNAIRFMDHFRHQGPNRNHACMVFEVLGKTLLGLIKWYQVNIMLRYWNEGLGEAHS
jgi:hypothetical protein